MQKFSEQLGYTVWYTKKNCPVLDYWKRLRFKPDIIKDPSVLGLLYRYCVLLVLNGD